MDMRVKIQDYYTERLVTRTDCCGTPIALDESPPSFGCGEPTRFAALRPGETVLDLGSGAGLDIFRAAEAIGPAGRAIGVDMTPAMVAKAREGGSRLGLANVEFREGFIEDLPVEDASVDAVLSNCVINLSTDKPAVFREAYRVLRPGGRLLASDILRRGDERSGPLTAEGWCACIDGAESAERYEHHLRAAGFVGIEIDAPPSSLAPGETYSATVRAVKPQLRPAAATDLERAGALLDASALPTAGIDDPATELFLLEGEQGELLGLIGLEAWPPFALLRSLAVRTDDRGRGLGSALLAFGEAEAQRQGFRTVFGLTTTIPGLLERRGYRRVSRAALPAELQGSAELQGACPDTALAFRKDLS